MLTPLEQESQSLFVLLRDMMSPGNAMTKTTHLEVCTLVRNILIRYENKEHGCETGQHAWPCQCRRRVS